MKPVSINKGMLLAVTVLLILASAVSGTVAWLTAESAPVKNTFAPASVSCIIEESFSGNVKSNVSIKNTGDIDAYIRAAIVVTWQDTGGNVSAVKPVLGTDYALSLNTAAWVEKDGFYYHKAPVAPGGNTSILITTCEPLKAKDGYKLNVEILASAIQATPAGAVANAWGVSIGNDGKIE